MQKREVAVQYRRKLEFKKNTIVFCYYYSLLYEVLFSNPTCLGLVSKWMLSSLDHVLVSDDAVSLTRTLHLHSDLSFLCQTFLLTHRYRVRINKMLLSL